MKIFGAGITGLIAANMFRSHNPVVYEIKDELPDNNGEPIHFRSDEISWATGMPFKKVQFQKNIFSDGRLHDKCNIKMANAYSRKANAAISGRTIWNLDSECRYIPPNDFIKQISAGVDIELNRGLGRDTLAMQLRNINDGNNMLPIISTIPMPSLMHCADWKKPDFKYSPTFSLTCELDFPCDVYQTIYFPDAETDLYRASIIGNKFIAEFMEPLEKDGEVDFKEMIIMLLDKAFGINAYELDIINEKSAMRYYGSIYNDHVDETEAFIMAMTDKYGIYSLGESATWQYLCFDKVISDCHAIGHLIRIKNDYNIG